MTKQRKCRQRPLAGGLCALFAALFCTTLVIGPHTAPAYPRLVRIWCKKDYKRFCPRYKMGSSRLHQCMQANARYLSPVCKKALIDSGYARRYGY